MRRAIAGVALALIASGTALTGCSSNSDAATADPSPSSSASSSATDLAEGDCLRMVQDDNSSGQNFATVDCEMTHHGEVVLAQDDFFASWDKFPEETQLTAAAQSACDEAMYQYSGVTVAEATDHRMSYLYPTQETWQAGDRKLTCIAIAYDSNYDSIFDTTGSLKKEQ